MNVNNNSSNGNFRHRRNFKKNSGGSGGGGHRNDFRRPNNNHNTHNTHNSGNHSSHGRHPELDIVIDGKAVKKASMMRDKYQALARDAQSSGDRVQAEHFLQHADHYNRILIAANELRPQQYRPVDASGEGFEEPSFENDASTQGNTAPAQGNGETADAPQPVQQAPAVAPAEDEILAIAG